jgi:hypothetical protein
MTASRESEPLSEREAFENGFYYFVQALEVLALPASEQCERLDDFNVAWELKNDVGAAEFLLRSPSSSRLSQAQRAAVESLLVMLTGVPVAQLRGGREANLEAMRHESWEPLRPAAAELLHTLAPAIAECKRSLRFDEKATS